MNYWLIKSEPDAYSWDDLVKEGTGMWDGVRNYAARNNLREMKIGDLLLFYHSVSEKAVVGIAKVVKEAYPDPTIEGDTWSVVDLSPVEKLKNPVTLAQIKADKRLAEMKLIKIGRLSVSPVTKEEYDVILELGS